MTYPPQPGQGTPGGPPPGYYPPPGWHPQPPPKQGGGLKWLLIGVAVLLVIAIAVGITVVVTRDGSGPNGTTSTAERPQTSDIASANDTGPVAIITSEPTCPAWIGIHNTLANVESNGWGQRDPSSESSSWSSQLRSQYEAVGTAMRSAADQVVPLAKQTPHRVMREMYEQFIVYGRAYANSISSYDPTDDMLSLVNVYFDDSIAGVCNAIDRGNITGRSAIVPAAQPPKTQTPVGDVTSADRFVASPTSGCAAWVKAATAFELSLDDWGRQNPNVSAMSWTPEQRSVQEGAARKMDVYATTMDSIGLQEGGAFQDFANFAGLYLRAYVAATPTYVPSDVNVVVPALRLNNAITQACKAAGG